MDQLIPIDHRGDGTSIVSGRALHAGLEIATPYAKWFARMAEYDFIPGQDYEDISVPVPSERSDRTYEQTDHALTLDTAKEIAMLQRSERGREIRRYFIAAEKRLRELATAGTAVQLPQDYASALRALASEVEERQRIEARAKELEGPAESWAALAEAKGDYDLRDAAQILSRAPGIRIGQNRLADKLREWRWTGENGRPYQPFVDRGLMFGRARTYEHPKTGLRVTAQRAQLRITPKGLHEIRLRLSPNDLLLDI